MFYLIFMQLSHLCATQIVQLYKDTRQMGKAPTCGDTVCAISDVAIKTISISDPNLRQL